MLEEQIQIRLHQALEEDPRMYDLSLVYALAERQVMRNMVDTLETLLEVTGSLFGTSMWLAQESYISISTRHEDDDHGWFSTFRWEEV